MAKAPSDLAEARASAARRYPGTRSFEDDALDRAVFQGRAREQDELFHLVLAERLVVLFARSGMGKTSLINAGLLAPLRDREYCPLVVRVNDTEAGPLETVFQGIEQGARNRDVEYVGGDRRSLWHFFKTVELWRGDTLLIPVLIIDQFEELFTLHRPDRRQPIVDQLADLVRGIRPRARAGEEDAEALELSDAAPPVKVVLSLREDFLAHLEELAARIPGILNNRYRLGPLGRGNARRAIVEPARLADGPFGTKPFSWTDAAVERVLDFLCQRKTDQGSETGEEVEPFQLQLLCQHVEDKVRKRQESGESAVAVRSKEELGDDEQLRDILSYFYEDSIAGTSARFGDGRGAPGGKTLDSRLQLLCEYGLITDAGRRLSVEETDIGRRFAVTNEVLDDLVDRRLLRREPRIGSRYYELTHDTLVDPILSSRKRREEREQRRRKRQRAAVAVVIALLSIVLIAVAVSQKAIQDELAKQVEEQSAQLSTKEKKMEEWTVPALSAFGWKTGTVAIDSEAVEASFLAKKRAEDLAARMPRAQWSQIEIQYFPKLGDDVHLEVVLGTLRAYGFAEPVSIPPRESMQDVATNAIWLGESVTVEQAQLITYTLIAAGVEIRGVSRFENAGGPKARIVQIGASGRLRDHPALAVADVDRAGTFPWYPALRLVAEINDPDRETRVSATAVLMNEHAEDPWAASLALATLDPSRIEELSPSGLVNTLLYLKSTRPPVWDRDRAAEARSAIAWLRQRSLGPQTRGHLDAFEAILPDR